MEEQPLSAGRRQHLALGEYVVSALSKARYQILEDGTYYADIFLCPGVWAIGDTPEECREVLQEALSDWLIAAYEGRSEVFSIPELALLNPRLHRMSD